MSLLQNEIKANYESFTVNWQNEMATVLASLSVDDGAYLESYTKITSLQAWRSHLEGALSEESLAFFLEAQNDLLTSHVFARVGSWRSALKALRSAIDNILFCCYYKDHPVELQLWMAGQHKPTFSELFTYFDNHPLRVKAPQLDASQVLRVEYSTLSKAVHASAKNFRMTKDIKQTQLWSDSVISKSMWQTREQAVITAINCMLLCQFRVGIQGASSPALRDTVGLTLARSLHSVVKEQLGIILH